MFHILPFFSEPVKVVTEFDFIAYDNLMKLDNIPFYVQWGTVEFSSEITSFLEGYLSFTAEHTEHAEASEKLSTD
jgi:hypothetical protein